MEYYKRGLDSSNIFIQQLVTKEQYEETLRAYHDSVNETKSEDRDKAAAERSQHYEKG